MTDQEQTNVTEAAADQKIELVAESQRQTPMVTYHRKTSRKIGDDWNTAEAVVVLPLDADEAMIAQAKALADQLAGQFPLPEPVAVVSGVNEWYTPALARAVSHLYLVGTLTKVSESQGRNLAGEVVLLFGKHQGKTIGQLDEQAPDYLQYIFQQGYEAQQNSTALSPEFRLAYAAVSAYATIKSQGENDHARI